MPSVSQEFIRIVDASENNLKNVSVDLPKKKITVFTGVSGSGKSSLCLDTIAAESRRELNETFPSFVQQYLPKYGRPRVGRIENLPVTIILDQKKPAQNSRSTVGTYTDIYAQLRLLYSRVGRPFIGYSDAFSFNHPSGMCPRCEGIGEVTDLDVHKLIDFDKSLNDEGVINFPAFTTGAWRWKRYAYSGLFDLDKKIRDYSPEELELFLYSPQIKLKNPPDNWPKSAKFEGIVPRMYRSVITQKEGKRHQKLLDQMVTTYECPVCNGTRVNEKVRSCKIGGNSIADVVAMPIDETISFIQSIADPVASDLKKELELRLRALVDIGLGYLTLSRGISTLSGGEAQRTKIAKYINSSLTDLVYVFDEPSAGLHHSDLRRLRKSLMKLRDHGNTILIVEHHPEIIELADHVIDMGPFAGEYGGEVMFTGSYPDLLASGTLTGRSLRHSVPLNNSPRKPSGWHRLEQASLHNLKNVTVDLPLGVLAVIAGVAGSGKSSLMRLFEQDWTGPIVSISQKAIGATSRSTPATYLGISDDIRKRFAQETGAPASLFSFNSKGGCPACGGKGIIVTGMHFMDPIETVCEVCDGTRYAPEVLRYRVDGRSIADVMGMSVKEAIGFFGDELFTDQLIALNRVGLGYIRLDQSMSTLSGGELQRVKLASHLNEKGTVFIMDEPTEGLHPDDTLKLLDLFHQLVEEGNSLFLIEHQLNVIKQADYLIELGPGGGNAGGNILFTGMPEELLKSDVSVTRPYVEESLKPGRR
ncbi:ATP-binding cassette domain-containing protein [Bhargavaea beijingensis]|uniref:UvrABC system protein A n=1 Tax=Bhargavaea beijingensis TaxID=426756 RepID=A0A1G7GYQ0_9BACL|nr:excinuclease ABC subunit UvrA [Bhargavaea beijingensis]RSK29702.1 excinuclease ABC subunit UvrA [Bhargavaea beijingensis]SDE93286.1 excinuclease ABC, A subunit [Bhargavaea beijingensis]